MLKEVRTRRGHVVAGQVSNCPQRLKESRVMMKRLPQARLLGWINKLINSSQGLGESVLSGTKEEKAANWLCQFLVGNCSM